MKRINTWADTQTTGKAIVDLGDGIQIPLPVDGVFPGKVGPAGAGVPTGGAPRQVIRKTATGETTEWVTLSKAEVGLSNVDNTPDTVKPVSAPQAEALAGKADLVGGKVSPSQLPAITPVTDSTIAPLINGATTGAAIDARINQQVAPQVQQLTASYIAGDRAVADAAAAAVNAAPKIVQLETRVASAEADTFIRGPISSGMDLNLLLTPGVYRSSTSSGMLNTPPGVSANAAALITVENVRTAAGYGTWAKQTIAVYGSSPQLWWRVSKNTTGTWNEWVRLDAPVTPPPTPTTVTSDMGLSNSVLLQDWSRRMGGRKKVTTATVAFRFDHGLSNFDTKVRPELDARNFKYSLALCSGQWSRAENTGVTASMVNGWVAAGRAEIWNHSKDHGSGDNSESVWKAAILDGLTELRAQLPAAQIDGFAPPGSTGTNFGGFTDGKAIEQFHATDGGRFILANHAVAAGYIGVNNRWQDGTPRQGLGHYTLDSYTLAQVQTLIQGAEASKRAIQFMLHPSLLDNGNNITGAAFVSMLDYIKAEEAAGRLKVVSPYEQLLTDAV